MVHCCRLHSVVVLLLFWSQTLFASAVNTNAIEFDLTLIPTFEENLPVKIIYKANFHSDSDTRHDALNIIGHADLGDEALIVEDLPHKLPGKGGESLALKFTTGKYTNKVFWIYFNKKYPQVSPLNYSADSPFPFFKENSQVQFTGNTYAHETSDVRKHATNKFAIIPRGTVAIIKKEKNLIDKSSRSLLIHNPQTDIFFWIYYHRERPSIISFEPQIASRHQACENLSPQPVLSSTGPPSYSPKNTTPKSTIHTQLGFDYLRLDSQDKLSGGRAIIISNQSPQYRLGWRLLWNPYWTSLVDFSLTQQKILSSGDHQQRLSQDTNRRVSYAFGIQTQATDKIQFGIKYENTEKIFLRSLSSTEIQTEHISIPGFSLFQNLDLYKYPQASFGLGLKESFFLPTQATNYSVNSGWGYLLSSYIKHEFLSSKLTLFAEVYFEKSSQNTNLASQHEEHLGTFFGLQTRIGP